MSVVLDVRPAEYAGAAWQVNRVSGGVDVAWMDLLFDLEDSVGMAGSDPAGAAWGAWYDDAAASAWWTTQQVLDAYVHVAQLLQQTGRNYARAEAAATHGQAGGVPVNPLPVNPLPVNTSGLCTAPTATGAASTSEPAGWHLLAHVIGRLWPNGHQDRLHAAAAAWNQAARELLAPLAAAEQAIADVAGQRTPESSAAAAVVHGVQGQTRDLAALYRQIGQACTDYAHQLDQAHHAIISELESFLKWTAGIEIVGGAFALFTLGASEAVAQGIEGAEATRAAALIRDTIDTLKVMTDTVEGFLGAVRAQFTEITDAMRLVLQRQLVGVEIVGTDTRVMSMASKVDARVASGAVTSGRALNAEEAVISRLEARQLGTGSSHETWGNPRTLAKHFRDHGKDFGSTSEEDYAGEARSFLQRALHEKLPTKVDMQEGSIRIYDPNTNTFGVFRLDGRSRSLYKPPGGASYWDRQGGNLIK